MKVRMILMMLLIAFCWGCMDKKKEYSIMLDNLLDGSVPFITPEELSKRSENYILLDTRTAQEFEVSHLPDARFIPYDDFSEDMVDGISKDSTVIVYCSVGYRSEKIGEKLKSMGYGKVLNLYGGIFEWKNEGHEVVNSQGTPTDSVHTYNRSWSRWLWNGTRVYD